MKILLLYSTPWYNATAYYTVNLAEGLQDAGHSVWIGSDVNVPIREKAVEAGIDTFDLKMRTGNPFAFVNQARKLARFVMSNDVDVIDTLSPQGHLLHYLAATLFGCKAPLVRACCDVREPNNTFFNRKMYSKEVGHLIFPCDANRKRYQDILKFPDSKISVVYPALNLKMYDENSPKSSVRERFNIPADAPLMAQIGRLSPEKGQTYYIDIAAKVAAKVPNARFLVVGKEYNTMIPELEEYARNAGVFDRVHFTGFDADPRGIISELTVGVITSRHSETICRVGMEYFAAGIPVVSTDVNILSEIIEDGVNGFHRDKNDVDGMAEAIIKILTDNELRTTFSRNARRILEEKYTRDLFVRTHEQIFEKLGNSDA